LILKKLQFNPIDLVGKRKEKNWIENYKILTNEGIINAMVLKSILIERPIVIKGNKAMIARDLAAVLIF
jgi:arsenate reductase